MLSPTPTDVLLAEDNPSDAELVSESLSSLVDARRIRRAHDGVEALDFLLCRAGFEDRAELPPPRLVLLDIKLPRVGGFEVLEELRRDPRAGLVPVVMLTSSNVERDVARAYRLGANAYVQKPVDFVAFRQAVRSLGDFWLSTNEPPPGGARAGGS